MTHAIEVRNVRREFQQRSGMGPPRPVRAVDGVTFSLPAGDVLGVVGESGCGKSVTALPVLRLVADPPGRIVGGAIRFEGTNLLDLSEHEMEAVRATTSR